VVPDIFVTYFCNYFRFFFEFSEGNPCRYPKPVRNYRVLIGSKFSRKFRSDSVFNRIFDYVHGTHCLIDFFLSVSFFVISESFLSFSPSISLSQTNTSIDMLLTNNNFFESEWSARTFLFYWNIFHNVNLPSIFAFCSQRWTTKDDVVNSYLSYVWKKAIQRIRNTSQTIASSCDIFPSLFLVLHNLKCDINKKIGILSCQSYWKLILVYSFTSQNLKNSILKGKNVEATLCQSLRPPRVDFTNVFARIFCTRFSYECLFSSYVLQKMRAKTLVKSTPSVSRII